MALGNRAALLGINIRGLRRQHVPPAEQRAMLRAFRYVFGVPATNGHYPPLELPPFACLDDRAAEARRALPEFPRVIDMLGFVDSHRERQRAALCLPHAAKSAKSRTSGSGSGSSPLIGTLLERRGTM